MRLEIIDGDILAEIHANLTVTATYDGGWNWSLAGDHTTLGPVIVYGDAGSSYLLAVGCIPAEVLSRDGRDGRVSQPQMRA